jgi:hypothetical protein
MYQRPRIKLLFSRRTYDTLADYAQNTHDGIDGNANYGTPPSLSTYQGLIDALRDAITAWGTIHNRGSRGDHENLLVARTNLEVGIMQMAAYCESATPYDAAALTNAGWEIKNISSPAQPLPAPANLRQIVRANLAQGLAKIKCNLVKGAKAYIFSREAVAPETAPVYYNSSNTEVIISDLIDGQLYRFRVAALGGAGMGATSDVCEVRVTS